MNEILEAFGSSQTAEESRAQDLCFDAMGVPNFYEKIRICSQAILIYPRCVEAWSYQGYCLTTGPFEIRDYHKALECCDKAIEYGVEREMRPGFLREGVLHWGHIENRPYLRAIWHKSLVLQKLGRINEEVEMILKFLHLCPTDNIGVRFRLITSMAMNRDFERMEQILTEFSKSFSSSTYEIYSILLCKFVKFSKGEIPVTDLHNYLQTALDENPYVPGLLTKDLYDVPIPEMDMGYSGDAVEANAHQYVGFYQGFPAWRGVPGAVDWLKAQMHHES